MHQILKDEHDLLKINKEREINDLQQALSEIKLQQSSESNESKQQIEDMQTKI